MREMVYKEPFIMQRRSSKAFGDNREQGWLSRDIWYSLLSWACFVLYFHYMISSLYLDLLQVLVTEILLLTVRDEKSTPKTYDTQRQVISTHLVRDVGSRSQ